MVRLVSLSEKAYSTLSRMKFPGESFSTLVLKLAEKESVKGKLSELAGAWGSEGGHKRTREIIDGIYDRRHAVTRRKLGW